MATKARLTAEDLWRIGTGDVRRELVNGQLIEMAPAGAVHGRVTARISLKLVLHVDAHGGGEIVTGDVGFRLSVAGDPERVRAPDVAFVAGTRLPEGRLPQGFIQGAPDLSVEVLSPSDNSGEIQQKVRDYLEAGSRLVWVAAPHARSVTVYRPDGSTRLVREPECLDGEDVLPGLTISMAEIFQ